MTRLRLDRFRGGRGAPHAHQPWADIRGMGNRLRHGCDRLSLDVIWNSLQADLPSLGPDVRLALNKLQREPPN